MLLAAYGWHTRTRDLTKGQIDALANRLRGARQGVSVVALGLAAHQQQIAVAQFQRLLHRRIVAMLECETSPRAQAH